MLSQSQIESRLSVIKAWYKENYPICVFCGHLVREKEGGQLAHLIRRSYSKRYETLKLNTGLAHHDCHEIFDNDFSGAVHLPRIAEVLYIIWTIDKDYFNLIAPHFEDLSHLISQFPDVPAQDLTHHGELITLQYLA